MDVCDVGTKRRGRGIDFMQNQCKELDHSTISTVVSSLVAEGLAEKQRDGKKVLVKRPNWSAPQITDK